MYKNSNLQSKRSNDRLDISRGSMISLVGKERESSKLRLSLQQYKPYTRHRYRHTPTSIIKQTSYRRRRSIRREMKEGRNRVTYVINFNYCERTRPSVVFEG